MKKIENGREYRSAQNIDVVEDIVITTLTTEERKTSVTGYATTFNEPYYLYQLDRDVLVYEQIDRNAFANTDMSDVIFQYNHEGHVYARMSNGTLGLTFDDYGMKVDADLTGTTIGRQLQEEIEGGYTTKMSWGFAIVPDSDEVTLLKEEDGKRIYLRTIREVKKIYDVSAVSIPANDATEISAQRSLDGVIKAMESDRIQALEEKRKKEVQKKLLKVKIEKLKGGK